MSIGESSTTVTRYALIWDVDELSDALDGFRQTYETFAGADTARAELLAEYREQCQVVVISARVSLAEEHEP